MLAAILAFQLIVGERRLGRRGTAAVPAPIGNVGVQAAG